MISKYDSISVSDNNGSEVFTIKDPDGKVIFAGPKNKAYYELEFLNVTDAHGVIFRAIQESKAMTVQTA
jgi:hypothetical protein